MIGVYGVDWDKYQARVRELEAEGLTTSDAQGVADVEFDTLKKQAAARAGR